MSFEFSLKGKTVLILGVNGFIGVHLANYLVKQGVSVFGIGRSCEKSIYLSPIVKYFGVDLFSVEFGNVAYGSNPDIIFDLTFIAAPNADNGDSQYIKERLEQYRRLLKDNIRGIRYFFVSSGGTVYGDGKREFRETDKTNPISIYAKTKIKQEALIADNLDDYCILRLTNPYGGVQVLKNGVGFIAYCINMASKGKAVNFTIPPDSCRDYLHIDDVVKIFGRLSVEPLLPKILNVSSGVGTQLIELAELIYRTCNRKLDWTYDDSSTPQNALQHNVLDNTSLQSVIGDLRLMTVEEGIRKTIKELNFK